MRAIGEHFKSNKYRKPRTPNDILLESKNQIQWDGNPKIGWWKDTKVLRLYHGTNIEYLESISKEGLNKPDPKTGMISFAIEPFTARAFAVMGGEARFLGAGAKAKNCSTQRTLHLGI